MSGKLEVAQSPTLEGRILPISRIPVSQPSTVLCACMVFRWWGWYVAVTMAYKLHTPYSCKTMIVYNIISWPSFEAPYEVSLGPCCKQAQPRRLWRASVPTRGLRRCRELFFSGQVGMLATPSSNSQEFQLDLCSELTVENSLGVGRASSQP